jgi:hypothetical protein
MTALGNTARLSSPGSSTASHSSFMYGITGWGLCLSENARMRDVKVPGGVVALDP